MTWLALVGIPPPLNELTRDGPYTGAREDISVEHAQFQLVIRLFQLPDHLVDELKVAVAVADEGIKQLRGAWIQFSSTEVNNTALSILIRPVLHYNLQPWTTYNKLVKKIALHRNEIN